MRIASIGFRSKTAKAIAVALSRDGTVPVFAGRWEVALHDPRISATSQPHHEVMEMPWAEAQVAVLQYERRIERIAADVLTELRTELQTRGFEVSSVGVVGSPDRKLEKIGNSHIRAHAAEGILFRRVLETAAVEHKLECRSFSAKTLDDIVSPDIKQTLVHIGRAAGKPWRADERAAATAAWLALPQRTSR
jgi:hypothetical protein